MVLELHHSVCVLCVVWCLGGRIIALLAATSFCEDGRACSVSDSAEQRRGSPRVPSMSVACAAEESGDDKGLA